MQPRQAPGFGGREPSKDAPMPHMTIFVMFLVLGLLASCFFM
ncbi:hypothetical protein [Pelagibius sp.]